MPPAPAPLVRPEHRKKWEGCEKTPGVDEGKSRKITGEKEKNWKWCMRMNRIRNKGEEEIYQDQEGVDASGGVCGGGVDTGWWRGSFFFSF